MTIVGKRLKELRVSERYTQTQIAEMCSVTQVTIGRYETGVAEPTLEKLLWYAEKFEVSLDYIFGRTDNPKGMLYQQDIENIKTALPESKDIESFAELCFKPGTELNAKLKAAFIRVLQEVKE